MDLHLYQLCVLKGRFAGYRVGIPGFLGFSGFPGFSLLGLFTLVLAGCSSTGEKQAVWRGMSDTRVTIKTVDQKQGQSQRIIDRDEVPSLALMQRIQARVLPLTEPLSKYVVSVSAGQVRGSGVLVGDRGLIYTAAHIAPRLGMPVKVWTAGSSQSMTARVWCVDTKKDICVLQLNQGVNQRLPKGAPLSMARAAGVKRNEYVMALGYPGVPQFAKALKPELRLGRIHHHAADKYESTATLIGGDSGGGLFNLDGELIAIHSRIRRDQKGNIHVPVHQFETLIQNARGMRQYERPIARNRHKVDSTTSRATMTSMTRVIFQ